MPLSNDRTPVALTDDSGNPVRDVNGAPMLRPLGYDPHYFTEKGNEDGILLGMANLPRFAQGAPWDSQRNAGAFTAAFTDDANVNIGLYASAAGIPQSVLLNRADKYAKDHSNFGDAPRDSAYPHMRKENVFDIRAGYSLQSSNAICTPKGQQQFQK
jgi:hypothetical protein